MYANKDPDTIHKISYRKGLFEFDTKVSKLLWYTYSTILA